MRGGSDFVPYVMYMVKDITVWHKRTCALTHPHTLTHTHKHTHIQDPKRNPTVSALMDTWTKQEGYPVVDMTFSGSKLTLSQRRFLAVPPDGYDPSSDDG